MATPVNVLRALAALEHSPEFRVVLEWLKALRAAARDTDQVKDEVLLRWAQGESRALTAILKEASSARATLNSMRN